MEHLQHKHSGYEATVMPNRNAVKTNGRFTSWTIELIRSGNLEEFRIALVVDFSGVKKSL